MNIRRLDIRPEPDGWRLTDGVSVELRFQSEREALEKARQLVQSEAGSWAIFAWHHGQPIELYRGIGPADRCPPSPWQRYARSATAPL